MILFLLRFSYLTWMYHLFHKSGAKVIHYKKKKLCVKEKCSLPINIQRRMGFCMTLTKPVCSKSQQRALLQIIPWINLILVIQCKVWIQKHYNNKELFHEIISNNSLYCRGFELICLLVSYKYPFYAKYLSADHMSL